MTLLKVCAIEKKPSEVHIILRLKQVEENSLKVFLTVYVLMIPKGFIIKIVTF